MNQDSQPDPNIQLREVGFRHSAEFLPILDRLGCSLLISTYQAGKLVVVGANDSQLTLRFHNFDQAMGIALNKRSIAVGSRNQVWLLQSAHELAAKLPPANTYDGCFLTRQSHTTGRIHVHEIGWCGEELWLVNTLFSCLCTLSSDYNFVPQWQPPFISNLEATDRCHLNGMAIADGRPKFVTAMSETDTPGGWRPTKGTSGCVIDVPTGQTIARGFAMPHSPRWHADRLWLLDSGRGQFGFLDAANGSYESITAMPGYTRGLAFHDSYAFVGLSRIRETSVFDGIPLAEHREQLRCGVAMVDLNAGSTVAYLEFTSGVDEIFDVQVVPNIKSLAIKGPLANDGDLEDIWVVPKK